MGDEDTAGHVTRAAERSIRALRAELEGGSPWGELRVVRELPGGNRRTVLLVERRGERFVAKQPSRSPEALAWLVAVQQRARQTGLVVPELVRSDRGALVEDGVTLERWIEGRPPDARSLARLHSLLRDFHEATRDVPQRPGFASSIALVERPNGGDIDLEAMPDDLVRTCRAAWKRLADAPRSAVHGDPNRDNIVAHGPAGRRPKQPWRRGRWPPAGSTSPPTPAASPPACAAT
ncbi:MAG: phosphotransferase [Deinococcales bacterium]